MKYALHRGGWGRGGGTGSERQTAARPEMDAYLIVSRTQADSLPQHRHVAKARATGHQRGGSKIYKQQQRWCEMVIERDSTFVLKFSTTGRTYFCPETRIRRVQIPQQCDLRAHCCIASTTKARRKWYLRRRFPKKKCPRAKREKRKELYQRD